MSKIFTDADLAEWRANGLDPDEAERWWDALAARLGSPDAGRWPLADDERSQRFTLSYALSWHAEGFDTFEDAEPWLLEFPVIDGAAAARGWRDAGWGEAASGPGSSVDAGRRNAAGESPADVS